MQHSADLGRASRRIHPPNGGGVSFSADEIKGSIVQRFEKIVRTRPEGIAVSFEKQVLTYDEINRWANRIARAILERRDTGSEPVALLFGPGADAVAAILGVQKAGKFFVAIDPHFPIERARYLSTDTQAPLMVTDSRHLEWARSIKLENQTLLNIDDIPGTLSPENLQLPIAPEDRAALMYTSGSTGEPKGIVETHRHCIENTRLNTLAMGIVPADRMALIHSISFSASKVVLHTALLNGAALLPFDIKLHGIDRFAAWLAEERITVVHCPPPVFRQLADVLSGPEYLADLRLIILTGALIVRADFELYKAKFSAHTLLEVGMGTSETGMICSALLDHDSEFVDEGSPAGYSYEGRHVLLRDENGREVAPGTCGEIVVKGNSFCQGYWQNPILTASKFITDPSAPGEQLFPTGDVGKMLPDGFLIHMGRKDSLVRIRGYRVSLREVEAAILQHPGVKEVAVIDINDRGEIALAAYVVATARAVLGHSELLTFLRSKLPDYMVPSSVTFLETLPDINGKIDRRALPPLRRARPPLEQSYVAPSNDIETELVGIWEEILSVRPIGIHDGFPDLGGHSIAAMQVLSRTIQRFAVDIPLKTLFDSPTIAALAKTIAALRAANTAPPYAGLLANIESLSDEAAEVVLASRLSGKANNAES